VQSSEVRFIYKKHYPALKLAKKRFLLLFEGSYKKSIKSLNFLDRNLKVKKITHWRACREHRGPQFSYLSLVCSGPVFLWPVAWKNWRTLAPSWVGDRRLIQNILKTGRKNTFSFSGAQKWAQEYDYIILRPKLVFSVGISILVAGRKHKLTYSCVQSESWLIFSMTITWEKFK
jgi:hypothetical protein